ncbi:MAG: hypothetical protein AB8I08_09695 [Sandaracinaceae bacterium]
MYHRDSIEGVPEDSGKSLLEWLAALRPTAAPEVSNVQWASELSGHLRDGNEQGARAVVEAVGVHARHPITGVTPLHHVALAGSLAFFDELVAANANLHARTVGDGHTPLVFAAWGGQSRTLARIVELAGVPQRLELFTALQFLMGSRGKVVARDGGGRDHVGTAKQLLELGADPNTSRSVLSPADPETFMARLLSKAWRDGHDNDLVAVFLEHGGDPDARMPYARRSPLFEALKAGRVELADLLYGAGARWSPEDGEEGPLEALAQANGDQATFEHWVERGCDLTTDHAWRAARYAATRGHTVALSALGANFEEVDDEGRNLLTLAQLEGQHETGAILATQLEAQPDFASAIAAADESRAQKAEANSGRISGTILKGAFAGSKGHASRAEPGKLDVVVLIFGRETRVTVAAEDFKAD